MQNLKLTRPLVVFDLETTGINVEKDRVVQIAMIRVDPDGSRTTFETLVNPEQPIPPEASAVHGIKDADVRDKPTFSQIRREVEDYLAEADLAGFNSVNFDMPLLQAELKRAGSEMDFPGVRHLDAMKIFHAMERRDLTAAYRLYCGKDLTGAHNALADTEATLEILDAQIARYDEVPDEVGALHRFCNPDEGRYVDRKRKFLWNDQGEAEFTFGKFQGKSLNAVVADQRGRSYLEWMLGKDFSEEIKGILRDALDGTLPKKEV
ncbi:MAG: 3'-5' exonuclease [Candidatus Krumholzibacteriota bacterium]